MLSFRLPWRALQALRTVLQGRCSACPLPPRIFNIALCSQLSTVAGVRGPLSNTDPCLDMQEEVLRLCAPIPQPYGRAESRVCQGVHACKNACFDGVHQTMNSGTVLRVTDRLHQLCIDASVKEGCAPAGAEEQAGELARRWLAGAVLHQPGRAAARRPGREHRAAAGA